MTHEEEWFKSLEDQGVLCDELASLGWAFWPKNMNNEVMGYFDERSLRKLADEIERRNKPFWDEYNAHCLKELEKGKYDEDFEQVEDTIFPLTSDENSV